jgi:ATP/maltotriose-dependent transcriptional regulator MalT
LTRITSQKTLGAAQLTLILGPAGFGKTTLLAQAYRRVRAQGDAAVWLECSDLDAEPTHLVDTLYGAGAAAGMRRDNQEFTASDFALRIGQLGANVYVFVDAVERLVATDAETLVERLATLLPENIHLLLGSRRPLNAWFLQLELQGLGATIDAAQLRLTHAELTTLLPQRFNAEQIVRVEQMTEGWPVAVQMTRLRAADADSIAETLEWLTHEGLGLFDYLADRVLESISHEQRVFLRDTSILTAISVISATAILRVDNGFALMSAVLRLQPIVTITGDRDFTIRLHPLLRQYMRNELARQGHDYERELHRRAGEVLVVAGQVIEGVQHALLAEDLPLAVRLFERAGGEALIFKIGARRLHSLMAALPLAARALSLPLKLVDVLMASVAGRSRLTGELRSDLVHDLVAAPLGPGPMWREHAAGIAAAAVALLADLHEGPEADAVARCAVTERKARLQFPKDETMLGFILAFQVLIYTRHSSVEEAQRTFADYVALIERNDFGPQHPSVNPQRGLLAFLEGDMEAALGYLNRQPGLRVDRFAEPEPLLAQVSSVLIAAIHYERNEIETAHHLIDRVSVDPDRMFPETWALSCRYRAFCLDALGRSQEADHVLAEEVTRASRRAATRLGLIIEATQLELALRRDSPLPTGVERIAKALEIEFDRLDASWLFTASVAPAAVLGLLARGDAERARGLAVRWIQRSSACGHGPFRAAGHLLAARIAEALGDEPAALIEIMGALPLTAPGRLTRPYLDLLGGPPSILLRALGQLSSAATLDHLRAILRSCDALTPLGASGWTALSERERDVLSALSAHASTKAIAKHLGVSPETVKHHLKRIFTKLGVHSREEALRRVAHLDD